MSKNLSSVKLAPVDSKALAVNSEALGVSIDALLNMTASKKNFKLMMKDPKIVNGLVDSMRTFVAVDVQFDNGAAKIGKLINNILEKPEEDQRTIIAALCRAQGIAIPVDGEGKEIAGKAGIKHALFAAYPHLAKKSGKDTLAGKRFAYYLAAARGATKKRTQIAAPTGDVAEDEGGEGGEGTGEGSTGEGTGKAQPKTAADLFRRLYQGAKPEGQQYLMRLCSALGVEFDAWLPAETVTTGNAQTGA